MGTLHHVTWRSEHRRSAVQGSLPHFQTYVQLLMNVSFDCITLDASCLQRLRHLIKTKLTGSINQIASSQGESPAVPGSFFPANGSRYPIAAAVFQTPSSTAN